MKVKNLHTNKILDVTQIECIGDPKHKRVSVYTLSDGSRWCQREIEEHWQEIKEEDK